MNLKSFFERGEHGRHQAAIECDGGGFIFLVGSIAGKNFASRQKRRIKRPGPLSFFRICSMLLKVLSILTSFAINCLHSQMNNRAIAHSCSLVAYFPSVQLSVCRPLDSSFLPRSKILCCKAADQKVKPPHHRTLWQHDAYYTYHAQKAPRVH